MVLYMSLLANSITFVFRCCFGGCWFVVVVVASCYFVLLVIAWWSMFVVCSRAVVPMHVATIYEI